MLRRRGRGRNLRPFCTLLKGEILDGGFCLRIHPFASVHCTFWLVVRIGGHLEFCYLWYDIRNMYQHLSIFHILKTHKSISFITSPNFPMMPKFSMFRNSTTRENKSTCSLRHLTPGFSRALCHTCYLLSTPIARVWHASDGISNIRSFVVGCRKDCRSRKP